jgi:hypothetical protein
MKSKFFNSSVLSPTVAASKQNSAFADGDIVFDWQGFEIPKGTAKVLGATVILRAKNDAGQTVQPAGLDLLFAKGPVPDATPTSLGTVNAEITNFASTDIIGAMPFSSNDVFGTRTLYQSLVSTCETVLEPNPNSGSTKGVDKFYVAGIAAGALDFRSGLTVNESNFGAGTQTVITVADVDATLGFVAGDVIHAADDAVLGTIASVDSATQITLTAANTAAIEDDDVLYNINPIRIILHFSK